MLRARGLDLHGDRPWGGSTREPGRLGDCSWRRRSREPGLYGDCPVTKEPKKLKEKRPLWTMSHPMRRNGEWRGHMKRVRTPRMCSTSVKVTLRFGCHQKCLWHLQDGDFPQKNLEESQGRKIDIPLTDDTCRNIIRK